MQPYEINDLSAVGVIADTPQHLLPPEGWTAGHNMRVREQGMEKMKGYLQVFGTPGGAPHFALPVRSAAQTWLLYVSLTKGYVYDGATHTDITRLAGDYTAAATQDWNGTLLGGVPILNSGSDVPQFWASYSTGTKLQNLTNWPSTLRAKVIRALGPHLIAAGITKSAVLYPHMVKVGHPADPGSVPVSWDETDPTKDTFEADLSDTDSGIIMTMMPLRGNMYIYKENATWRMRYIGGRNLWALDTFLETLGAISPRSVCILGDGLRHAVWGQDDIIIHNGQTGYSILKDRFKRALFRSIDPVAYRTCFSFCKPDTDEVWFCYPTLGQTSPNQALVWNYRSNEMGVFTTADVNWRNVTQSVVETSDSADWDTDVATWDSDTTQWNQIARRQTLFLDPVGSKFHQADASEDFNGTPFTSTLRREALALLGQKRNGDPIVDFEKRKFYNRVWIKATGGPFDVRCGVQDLVDGPITWSPRQSFDPATQMYADFLGSGRAVAIEFETQTPASWRIDGYKPHIDPAGGF